MEDEITRLRNEVAELRRLLSKHQWAGLTPVGATGAWPECAGPAPPEGRGHRPWSTSTRLNGDSGDAVGQLKGELGRGLIVLGSGDLVRSLMERKLVDQSILLPHALVVGSGRRLFAEVGPEVKLRVVDN